MTHSPEERRVNARLNFRSALHPLRKGLTQVLMRGVGVCGAVGWMGVALMGCSQDSSLTSSATALTQAGLYAITQGLPTSLPTPAATSSATVTVSTVTYQAYQGQTALQLTGTNLDRLTGVNLTYAEGINTRTNPCEIVQKTSTQVTVRPIVSILGTLISMGYEINYYYRNPPTNDASYSTIRVLAVGTKTFNNSFVIPSASPIPILAVNGTSSQRLAVAIGASATPGPSTAPSPELLIVGKTSDISTTALRVSNSGGTILLQVRNDGRIDFGNPNYFIAPTPSPSLSLNGLTTVTGSLRITGTTQLNDVIFPTNTPSPIQVYQLSVGQATATPTPTPVAAFVITGGTAGSPTTWALNVANTLFVRNDGFVGIGTASPSPIPSVTFTPQLQINGNTKINGAGLILGSWMPATLPTGSPGPACSSTNQGQVITDATGSLCTCSGGTTPAWTPSTPNGHCAVHTDYDCVNTSSFGMNPLEYTAGADIVKITTKSNSIATTGITIEDGIINTTYSSTPQKGTPSAPGVLFPVPSGQPPTQRVCVFYNGVTQENQQNTGYKNVPTCPTGWTPYGNMVYQTPWCCDNNSGDAQQNYPTGLCRTGVPIRPPSPGTACWADHTGWVNNNNRDSCSFTKTYPDHLGTIGGEACYTAIQKVACY